MHETAVTTKRPSDRAARENVEMGDAMAERAMRRPARARRRGTRLAAVALVAGLLVSALALAAPPTSPPTGAAGTGGAYLNANSTGQQRLGWMAPLPDGTTLSRLSIPGTHDTGASPWSGWTTETQSMTPAEQLKAGIRAMDVRLGRGAIGVCDEAGKLFVYHGSTCFFVDWEEFVLGPVASFLAAHPSETVIIRVKEDSGLKTPNFAALVKAAFDRRPGLLYTGASDNPTLGEIRGKVVVLQEYAGPEIGIPWPADGSPRKQDYFALTSNFDLADKWRRVEEHFGRSDSGDFDGLYVNFLSGANGSFPYFVASGKSSWETDGPRLATPWVPGPSCNNSRKCIPEWHRSGGLIYFKGINELAMNHMNQRVSRRAGLVFADFPGQNLIDSVIALNPCNCDKPRADRFDKRLELAAPNPWDFYNGRDTFVDDSTFATTEIGEPLLPDQTARTLWYSYTAPMDGRLLIETCDGATDTFMEAFTGSTLGGLTKLAEDDDGCPDPPGLLSQQSRIDMDIVAGTEYTFRLSQKNGNHGPFTLGWRLFPTNDRFLDAQLISGSSGSIDLLNAGATKETDEQLLATQPLYLNGRTTWYRYQAPATTTLSVDSCNSTWNVETDLAVYVMNTPGTLTRVASSTGGCGGGSIGATLALPVSAGQTYWIQVDSPWYAFAEERRTGVVSLRWSLVTNDAFANARPLVGESGAIVTNNSAATTEPGEPTILGVTGGRSLWYRFTAPHDGFMEWNTCDSQVDTLLGMYTGSTVSALGLVQENDERVDECPPGATIKRVPVTEGVTYRVKVDGKAGAGGQVKLSWAYVNLIDHLRNAQTFLPTGPSQYTVNTAGSGPEVDEPGLEGVPASATSWFRAGLFSAQDATLTVDTCGSDFDTVLGLYGASTLGAGFADLIEGPVSDDAPGCGLGGRVQVNTTEAVMFPIQVDGVDGATGNLQLNWALGPRNDLVSYPTPLPGTSGSVSGTNVGTFTEPDEPIDGQKGALGASVWHSFVSPANGTLTVDTCGSGFDTTLTVYAADWSGNVASDDDGCTNGTSKVTLPVEGGTDYLIRVAGHDLGSGPETGTVKVQWKFAYPAAEPFATWSDFVNRQFTDLTGKAATAAQLSAWSNALGDGTKVEGDLFDGIRKGADHTANVDPTARLYRAFLGRTPDAGGLKFWVGRKRSGAWSLQRIADYFAASSEFKTKYGTLTNRQFATRIYTDVMGRPADPGGVEFWTAQLDQKKRTRGGVMIGFSESGEYKRRQAENTDVAVAYIFLLDRAPTPAEESEWVTLQKEGTTRSQLASDLLRSQKYIDHVAG